MSIKIKINPELDNVYTSRALIYSIVQEGKIVEETLEDNKIYELKDSQILVAWFRVYTTLQELWELRALTTAEINKFKVGYIRSINHTLKPEDEETYIEILGNDF